MKKSIGKIIRCLRKERNLTQEELAELLNVSGQAVSKWENETSMPDISQIVPIASVFGISTDVLFDTVGKSDDETAKEIIDECHKLIYDENGILNQSGLYEAYTKAREALNIYPNNIILLTYCLCILFSRNVNVKLNASHHAGSREQAHVTLKKAVHGDLPAVF